MVATKALDMLFVKYNNQKWTIFNSALDMILVNTFKNNRLTFTLTKI